MSWFTKLFSSGAKELVDSVGSTVDSWFTSDEERLEKRNELEQIINAHTEKQMQYVAQYDQEITKRHENDMKSDSWLSKNVRPLTLIFLTVTTVLLAYLTIFMLPVDKVNLLTPWITLLTTLLVTVYAFYFGSRGVEKVQKIKNK